MIPKSIFSNIKFDEKISTYGHEDTLFGELLKKSQIKIIPAVAVAVGPLKIKNKNNTRRRRHRRAAKKKCCRRAPGLCPVAVAVGPVEIKK